MMNIVWAVMIILSVIYSLASGNGTAASGAVFKGCENSIKLLLTLTVSMAVWSGIMNIADKSGVSEAVRVFFSPVLKLLFPKYRSDKKVMSYVSTNITANLIGIGNAATPAGLKAISAMYDGSRKADSSMSVFIVMNTASIQIIPTTIAAMRAAHGSKAPMEITVCIWISSFTALIVGVAAVKLTEMFRNAGKKEC